MAEKIQMIALSPTMEEGTIVKWNLKVGDSVKTGDVLCEVETDKATMEYESSQEGTILKIVLDQGSTAKVGDMIGIIGAKGEDISAIASSPAEASPAASSDAKSASKANETPASTVQASNQDSNHASGSTKASPLARKLAADRGIDLTNVSGTGPDGRVIKRDLEGQASGKPAGQSPSASTVVSSGQDQKIQVTGKRAVIAKRLAESLFTAPHFFLTSSVAMDNLIATRNLLNKQVDPKSKVGFNAFIIKLAAEALKRHAAVNASWQGDHILQFGSIDIGLAVDLGNGLITPIVRNAANKGVYQIDQELKVLIEKAGAGTLKPDEYSGATFTISNLGSFGVEEFTAIINPPGSAILALGEVKKTPVVGENDQIVVASIMKMTVSCDHRVIDGALGGRFIAELKALLEQPARAIF